MERVDRDVTDRADADTVDTGGEHHASTGGSAVAGAITGGVVGGAGAGPIGAVVGAVGGAIVGAAAERGMHSAEDWNHEEPHYRADWKRRYGTEPRPLGGLPAPLPVRLGDAQPAGVPRSCLG